MGEVVNHEFIKDVTWECLKYANKYNCTWVEALNDWEGDGPDGSWGLTKDEKLEVILEFSRIYEVADKWVK